MAQPLSERITKIKAQEDQLAARRAKLEAAEKAKADRIELRRKIVVGGAVLSAVEADPALAVIVLTILRQHVTRPADKDVIADMLPGSK